MVASEIELKLSTCIPRLTSTGPAEEGEEEKNRKENTMRILLYQLSSGDWLTTNQHYSWRFHPSRDLSPTSSIGSVA